MANQSVVSSQDGDDPSEGVQIPSLPPSGPRKLVRPSLPPGVLNGRVLNRRTFSRLDTPLLAHQQLHPSDSNGHTSHAEVSYLQKQAHAQTHMVFVLEDGERMEGTIEWYDADAIKIRHGSVRALIYKSAIKYLHKAGDTHS